MKHEFASQTLNTHTSVEQNYSENFCQQKSLCHKMNIVFYKQEYRRIYPEIQQQNIAYIYSTNMPTQHLFKM